jgi:putative ABC transport system substrate-binding protein
MERRKFLQLASGAPIAWSLPALAQNATPPLVAMVTPLAENAVTTRLGAQIRDGLKQAGLIEGKDYALTLRAANGDYSRMAEMIKELINSKPSVYVVVGGGPTLTHQLAPNTPLVFTAIGADPIAAGWADSYAKPGGMMTGNVQNAIGGWESIATKVFGFFREMVPSLTRLGLINVGESSRVFPERIALQNISARSGFTLVSLQMETLDDIDKAIAAGLRDDVSAFYVAGDPRLVTRVPQIVSSLAKTGKPACGPYPVWVRGGLLMSYSVDIDEQARRAGGLVAKILRGAKPGDLPIEQADKFTLVINLKTAKTLGVTVPDKLLALADELIE